MPPRHGKSELISRYLPAWFVGTFPDRKVILVTSEADFAADWGRQARAALEENAGLFGVAIDQESRAANRWNIKGREGGMRTAGVGGPITGKGADLLIVDDTIKNAEEAVSETYRDKNWDWWQTTAYTRLEPEGAAIVVHSRWHTDDLIGRILKESKEQWRVINLPALAEENDPLGRQPGEALWPERFPKAALENIRDNQALYWWSALYQQRPTKHGTIEWPGEYFDDGIWFDEWPLAPLLKVVALDPSKGKTERSDYSAVVMVGEDLDGTLWVEADIERRPVGQIVASAAEICRDFQPEGFGLEINSWQDLLAQPFLERFRELGLVHLPIECIHNRVAKEVRIRRLDALLRARRMRFRTTRGTRLLVSQLKEFPLAVHDDGPDALEMGVRLLEHYKSGLTQPGPVIFEYVTA